MQSMFWVCYINRLLFCAKEFGSYFIDRDTWMLEAGEWHSHICHMGRSLWPHCENEWNRVGLWRDQSWVPGIKKTRWYTHPSVLFSFTIHFQAVERINNEKSLHINQVVVNNLNFKIIFKTPKYSHRKIESFSPINNDQTDLRFLWSTKN